MPRQVRAESKDKTPLQDASISTMVEDTPKAPTSEASKKIVDKLSQVKTSQPKKNDGQTIIDTNHQATKRTGEHQNLENMEIPVSICKDPPEQGFMKRADMLKRARQWVKELEGLECLFEDVTLEEPKSVYCSTGIGDFTKVATWAQWYGVRLFSDLANIDRKRFALIAIEQYDEYFTFCYGLLHRDTGRIRHLFNLQVDQVGPRMRNQGIKIPSWLDVTDLDHYRVG